MPFESSVDDAFVLEVGHRYIRFYKNKARIEAGPPVELSTLYLEQDLRNIHFTQSVDVLFLFHPDVQQHRISRINDTTWSIAAISYAPPPSFEADTDISGGTATLTPGATSGNGVTFTASSAVWLAADVGRQIIFGASRAIIKTLPSGGSTSVTADIIDNFPNTNPIPAGQWFLRNSPQTTLDPNLKDPVGALVTLVAGANAFRTADVGKFIKIYSGVVRVTTRNSATSVSGIIESSLTGATSADPAAAPAGAWTLEEASWSVARGFPRTAEFFQGRLGQASTDSQKTTFWLSASDDFDNYAVGTLADNAIEYTIASRQLNQIEWIADNDDLFIGTSGSEHLARSPRDEPLGGDVVPLVKRLTSNGCAAIQPITHDGLTIFVDRSRKKIVSPKFNFDQDRFESNELTDIAEHITGTGLRLGPMAFQRRPDPRIWLIRDDGQMVALTFFFAEKVIGFSRIKTDGTFESVASIPGSSSDTRDQVWAIVKRTINGQTKRYVEVFEDNATELSGRPWKELHTDCAKVYSGASTTTITGLSHLEGKTVDVVADGGYRGTKVVSGGQITLDEAATQVEVGLHYESKLVTMRPAIEGSVIEGMPRSWDSLFVRVKDTIGGKINGEFLQYVPSDLDALGLFEGDRQVVGQGWDMDGRVTVEQTEPYPMTALAIFGTLSVAERD